MRRQSNSKAAPQTDSNYVQERFHDVVQNIHIQERLLVDALKRVRAEKSQLTDLSNRIQSQNSFYSEASCFQSSPNESRAPESKPVLKTNAGTHEKKEKGAQGFSRQNFVEPLDIGSRIFIPNEKSISLYSCPNRNHRGPARMETNSSFGSHASSIGPQTNPRGMSIKEANKRTRPQNSAWFLTQDINKSDPRERSSGKKMSQKPKSRIPQSSSFIEEPPRRRDQPKTSYFMEKQEGKSRERKRHPILSQCGFIGENNGSHLQRPEGKSQEINGVGAPDQRKRKESEPRQRSESRRSNGARHKEREEIYREELGTMGDKLRDAYRKIEELSDELIEVRTMCSNDTTMLGGIKGFSPEKNSLRSSKAIEGSLVHLQSGKELRYEQEIKRLRRELEEKNNSERLVLDLKEQSRQFEGKLRKLKKSHRKELEERQMEFEEEKKQWERNYTQIFKELQEVKQIARGFKPQ